MNINKELQYYSLGDLLTICHASWEAATISADAGDGGATGRRGWGTALYLLVVVVMQDFCVQETIGERRVTLT